MRHIRLISLFALSAALVPAAVNAQARVEYDVRFPNRARHEAEVTATFSGIPAGQQLELIMSRSSPGRYAVHEFAKNLYHMRVMDGQGRSLEAAHPDPQSWRVSGHDGTVRVEYTLFGDLVDGTYVGIDATHAHMNMPASFMWARGLETAPIRIRFDRPDGWRVATQLVPTADSAVFTAPNLQYFFDSPTEVSGFDLRSWTVAAPGGRGASQEVP